MSYKAARKIREHMEIQMLKKMSHEEINEILNEFKYQVDESKRLLTDIKEDLLIRAQEGSDGERVVNLSNSIWQRLKDAIKK